MNLKIAFDLFVVLVLFAFGPRENREFIFRSSPDLLYGELVIYRGDGGSMSLARNASSKLAELEESGPVRVVSRDTESGRFHASDGADKIYANTVAVIERSGGSEARVRFGDTQPAPPRELRVTTEAEGFHDFMWLCLIACLTAGLSYAICEFSWRCGSPLKGILGGDA